MKSFLGNLYRHFGEILLVTLPEWSVVLDLTTTTMVDIRAETLSQLQNVGRQMCSKS